jgi:hypothetical protein
MKEALRESRKKVMPRDTWHTISLDRVFSGWRILYAGLGWLSHRHQRAFNLWNSERKTEGVSSYRCIGSGHEFPFFFVADIV